MIENKAQKIDFVSPEVIVPWDKNANQHSNEQIERLCKIIEHNGFRDPLIISKRSGFLICGHGRLICAKKLKLETVPVIYQDFRDEAEEYQFMVAHNAIASWAELDLSAVNTEMLELGPYFDIDMLGIKDFVIEPIEKFEPQSDEDEVPEVVHPITRKGDLWILGNHRLLCGDSTMIDDVEKLMNGEKADITFTSPPYNAGKNIRGNFYEGNSDDKSEDDYTQFLNEFTNNALLFSKYVFVNIQILESNKKSIVKYQYHNIDRIKDVLIWNKKQYPPHINKGTFGCKWEYVFAFSEDGKSRSFPCEWQGKFPNVIETENNSGNEFAKVHKAGFPVSFPLWILDKMDFAKSCYDPFMGTGTTAIACESIGLKSFGMELSEQYCDVIVQRWQNYTGKKATLESTGQTYEELKAERENG